MKVWSAILNIFAVFVLFIYFAAYLHLNKALTRDFDQARLNIAMEYATKAMFKSALEADDIGTDYTDLSYVKVSPGDSLQVFADMMCFNYDFSTTDENRQMIYDSIAVAVLSGDDGFYITQYVENDTTPGNGVRGGEYELRWSPKIPFLIKIGNRIFAVNISQEKWVSIDSAGNIVIPTTIGYVAGITKDKVIELANQQIKEHMINEINNRNLNNTQFNFKFFLPADTTKSGVNPINGTGVMLLLQNAKFASSEQINAVSVSGYKTKRLINVVAFMDRTTGLKYYCYEGQIDPMDLGTKYIVENYFKTTREAAEKGYSPHVGLLTKKITKN